MATVTLKSIGNQFVLNNKDYNYLMQHIGTALPLLSLNYTPTGRIWSFAVYAGNTDRSSDCITVFVDESKVEYEVNYSANSNN